MAGLCVSEFLSQRADLVTAFATLLGSVVASITLVFVGVQVRHQSASRDAASILELQREFHTRWRDLMAAEDSPVWEFHLGELLSLYETSCYLANNKILGRRVSRLLKDHIIEVITSLTQDAKTLDAMKRISIGENTYEEIIAFFKRHKKDYHRHWKHLQDIGWITEA